MRNLLPLSTVYYEILDSFRTFKFVEYFAFTLVETHTLIKTNMDGSIIADSLSVLRPHVTQWESEDGIGCKTNLLP